ncbi:MAG: class I SAM-dependent methyltransferase [Gammaproteobacteria bacterium]|nr:class I SAM-dependent methyltransferase [Gammaproteobacteria bacterium]
MHGINDCLDSLLPRLFGYYALQIGCLDQRMDMLAQSRINHCIHLGIVAGSVDLLAKADYLPFKKDSLDLVLLLHTLDFAHDPHGILREIDRILIPEGHVVIVGFNPMSLYGLWKVLPGQKNRVPWCGRFYSLIRLRDWLSLLGFDTLANHCLGHNPPIQNSGLHKYLAIAEKVSHRLAPSLGALNVVLAQKKEATLTPIKPRWVPHQGLLPGNLAEPSTREVSRDSIR